MIFGELRKPCLCHCITALPLAVGTMSKCKQSASKQNYSLKRANVLFTFDRRLNFCCSFKMHHVFDYQGVECHREFKYPRYGSSIFTEVFGLRRKLEVIEESLNGQGFSAESDRFLLIPYDLVETNCIISGKPRQYVSLTSNPSGRLRFRFLFDTEEHPVQVITTEI
jgi:hypothetical protein